MSDSKFSIQKETGVGTSNYCSPVVKGSKNSKGNSIGSQAQM